MESGEWQMTIDDISRRHGLSHKIKIVEIGPSGWGWGSVKFFPLENNGVTPLHVASHYDHVNVALLLLDKGASPHATAKNGYTPLHIAAKKNQMDIASTLLEYGAKTNSESK
ncbi:Ankyrin-2, partial [Araneus ventricosus]